MPVGASSEFGPVTKPRCPQASPARRNPLPPLLPHRPPRRMGSSTPSSGSLARSAESPGADRRGLDNPARTLGRGRWSGSGCSLVFVDETAETIDAFDHLAGDDRRRQRDRGVELDRPVGSSGVVMGQVLGQDLLEVAAADDERPVQAFPPDGAKRSA